MMGVLEEEKGSNGKIFKSAMVVMVDGLHCLAEFPKLLFPPHRQQKIWRRYIEVSRSIEI